MGNKPNQLIIVSYLLSASDKEQFVEQRTFYFSSFFTPPSEKVRTTLSITYNAIKLGSYTKFWRYAQLSVILFYYSSRTWDTCPKFNTNSKTILPRVVHIFKLKMFHQEASVETIKLIQNSAHRRSGTKEMIQETYPIHRAMKFDLK